VESKLGPLGTAAIYCPIVPVPGDCEDGELFGGMKIGRGNRSTQRKPAPTPLSTTNPTWPDPGLNPGRRGGKPATNRLSYGAAKTGVKELCNITRSILCKMCVLWVGNMMIHHAIQCNYYPPETVIFKPPISMGLCCPFIKVKYKTDVCVCV
jgi:hypothetical protein